MSTNCVSLNCNEDIPVPTPTPLPPCPDGEPCKEVVDAACVVYTGDPLLPVSVDTNDRLDEIIQKWSDTIGSGIQAVARDNTLTAIMQGNGTGLLPLKVDVRISTRPQNLLKVVNELDEASVQRTGLEVLLSNALVASILTMIANDEALNAQFCAMVRPCLDNACGLATGLNVSPV
jgi:hypothetical protein